MRVLFTTQPGVGHLYPLLPVAAGLRGRGHDVLFAASASFAGEIGRAGFDAVGAGRSWLAVEMAKAFPEITSIPPGPGRYAWARRAIFAGHTAADAVTDLVAVGRSWRADLVVREAAEYGGCLAAELLDVPHAVVRTDTGSSSYNDRHHVAEPLSALRAHLGLPPDPDVEMPFRYLQLSFAPVGLDEPDEEAAPTCHHLRPAAQSVGGACGAPPWLAEMPRRRTVYATLGTIYNGSDLLQAIVEGLADADVNLVVTVGAGHDPASFGCQPAHVRIERWIDQHDLLPHCDAVVTHGGSGTLSAALVAGVPVVCIPISADQPLNAERCATLGVGRTVSTADRSPAAIRAATRDVLDDPSYRLAAGQVARATQRRPGLDRAVELLEALARHRTPIVRHPSAA